MCFQLMSVCLDFWVACGTFIGCCTAFFVSCIVPMSSAKSSNLVLIPIILSLVIGLLFCFFCCWIAVNISSGLVCRLQCSPTGV